jgi:hypothetical protein
MKSALFGILFFLVFCSPVFSQACCSGGTPLSSNLGIQSIKENTLLLNISYDYNTQRDLVNGTRLLKDKSRHRNTHSLLLRSSYAINAKFSITTLFALVRQEEKIFGSGTENLTDSEGPGDVVILGQYSPFALENTSILVAGGLTIPIGSFDKVDPETGILLNADLQPGSGAWDFITAVGFIQHNIFKPNLSFSLTGTYRFTSEASRFNGQQRYEFGNEFQTVFGFKDRYILGGFFLDPAFLMRYRHTDVDQVSGFTVPNTSGDWLHFIPGFDFILNEKIALGIAGEFPVYRNLEGTQLTTTSKLTLSFNYIFNFGSLGGIL